MRALILTAALALAAAGCDDAATSTSGGDTQAAAEGYTMEIRASSVEQTYIIVAPDGRTVGARAAEGASALMDANRAQALFADPPPEGEEMPETFSMRLPGFSMSVAGTDEEGHGENGRVNINIGGDGQNVVVRADEGGPGEEDDRAYVRITGADDEAVRDFIDEQEDLSAEVKAEMRTALGL
ncbi:MAG TPA: hypothetical protein VEA80_15310 [Vitreimonas sp.]|uniref:hypothetical protein n=1 Tax=Vitreimonas sp. TaxID=3069702 RepID=UPI002D61846A|nr:hypothetical protein [Vitreimonas sp.]HYD88841.1 hypothetical protein [Vitreimonas sp.]